MTLIVLMLLLVYALDILNAEDMDTQMVCDMMSSSVEGNHEEEAHIVPHLNQ